MRSNESSVQQNDSLEHFGNLHNTPRVIHREQHITLEKLKTMESESTHNPHELNVSISIQESETSYKSLKNKKACYCDLIQNEMTKISCEQL